ncbi:MAG TPA: CPXCG motif-containing cysteine-rich protein [Tenacibaculum sp.]|nr:CPXCG motif-containing cysteine-rich protein [Tenacibaculum sp.]HBI40752.1 CPXCG motif-containing cysteine-rich protein [Tenacibaculum sp.]
MIEHFFICPFCWREISMLIDTSISDQSYIEDCENCCNPIQIEVFFSFGNLIEFRALNTEK